MEEQNQNEEQVVVEGKPVADKPTSYQGVISKPEHETPVYHTPETAKIAEDRAKEVAEFKPEDYEFKANNYTVKAKKAEGTELAIADESGMVYVISGNGINERVEGAKRAAEVWVETHSASFADQSATMPSA